MQKKEGHRRVKVAPVVLSVLLVFTCFCCAQQGTRLMNLHQKKADYQAEYAALQQEHEQLLETRALLDDDAYMERLARERFKLIKPGEYLVVPAETDSSVREYVRVDDKDLH